MIMVGFCLLILATGIFPVYGALTPIIVDEYGLLGGATEILCTYHSSVDNPNLISWIGPNGVMIVNKSDGANDTAISGYRNQIEGHSFKLTIISTDFSDVGNYTCEYDGTTEMIELQDTHIEVLDVAASFDWISKIITLSVSRVNPGPANVLLEKGNITLIGSLNNGTDNGNRTMSYIWTSNDTVEAGMYSYTVRNAGHLTETGTINVSVSMEIDNGHGLLEGETNLTCTLSTGMVDNSSLISWTGPIIDQSNATKNGYTNTFATNSFTLTIQNSTSADVGDYECSYNNYTASFFLSRENFEVLSVSASYDRPSHVITLSISRVNPAPPKVVGDINGVELAGLFKESGMANQDGMSYSYTWNSTGAITIGRYNYTVRNSGHLTFDGHIDIGVQTYLVNGYGILEGKTNIKCLLGAGIVDANLITWKGPNNMIVNEGTPAGGYNNEIESRSFTLTIHNTDSGDLGDYVCIYNNKSESTFTLEEKHIELLEYRVMHDDARIKVIFDRVKPNSSSVELFLNGNIIMGTLGQVTDNSDMTCSAEWSSDEDLVAGTYNYVVSNGKSLQKTGTETVPASLFMVGSYGRYGNETILKCVLEAGTATDDMVNWIFNDSPIAADDEKYDIREHIGDSFSLAIKMTDVTNLGTYKCTYGVQVAEFELKDNDIQALEIIASPGNSTIQIYMSHVFPNNTSVTVTYSDGNETQGTLGNWTLNENNLTYHNVWNSDSVLLKGTYTYNVTNGADLRETGTITITQCSKFYYGNCDRNCSCVEMNSDGCNDVGICLCKNGYDGFDCGHDEDECNIQDICTKENSRCTNFAGGYSCDCKDGFMDVGSSCDVCPSMKYGDNCSRECPCFENNTIGCDNIHGKCECKAEWTGQDCNTDVNECDLDTDNCSVSKPHSRCENTDGSFECICVTGFNETSDEDCIECDNDHWGPDCANMCSCTDLKKTKCNNVDGTCSCDDGWTGDTCGDNIDECVNNPCGNGNCVDSEGSYSCDCNVGYSNVSRASSYGTECKGCDAGHYGSNCQNTCSCIDANTEECDDVTGQCTCKTGWDGNTCENGIDECSIGSVDCGENSACSNTQGGHTCICNAGWGKDRENKCKGRAYIITITLDINGEINNTLKTDIDASLQIYYATKMMGFIGAYIDDIREGSVIVEHTIVMEDTLTAPSEVAATLSELAMGNSRIYYNQRIVPVQNVTVQNIDDSSSKVLDSDSDQCVAFLAISKCEDYYECVITDDKPVCRNQKKDDNFEMVVGLSVGIPLFLLAMMTLVLALIYRSRQDRKKKFEQDRRSDPGDVTPPTFDDQRMRGHVDYFGVNYFNVDNNWNRPSGSFYRQNHGYPMALGNNRWQSIGRVFNPDTKFQIRRPKYSKQPLTNSAYM